MDLVKYHKFGCTPPYEYARAYKMIYDGKVINEKVSHNILEVLKKQKHHDMLVKNLPQLDILFMGTDESVINYIASKSGTIIWTDDAMKNARNDGGIISTKYGDYIISIFISNLDDLQFNYDNKGIDVGAEIGRIIFEEFTNE